MSYKDICIILFSSNSHFLQRSETVCATLVFEFGQAIQEEMSLKDISILSLAGILFSGAKPFVLIL